MTIYIANISKRSAPATAAAAVKSRNYCLTQHDQLSQARRIAVCDTIIRVSLIREPFIGVNVVVSGVI